MDDLSDDARNRGPGIPLIFADSPVSLATAELGLTQTMLAEATRFYGGLPLRIGDLLSKHWLKHLCSPYKDEIAAIPEVMG